MTYCLTGKHIQKAVLTTRKAGSAPLDFLTITMTDVIITAVEPAASGGGYYEQVRLSFSEVKQEYKVQNALGGTAGVVTGIFRIKENVSA